MKELLPYAPLLTCVAVIVSAYLLHSRVKDSNLSSDSQWKGRIEESINSVNTRVSSLWQLFQIFIIADTIRRGSPLTLTDLGEKVSKRISAPEHAQEVSVSLRDRARGKTSYEIQQMCLDYVLEEYKPSEEVTKAIQQCAYDLGTNIVAVRQVIAILARDKILETMSREV